MFLRFGDDESPRRTVGSAPEILTEEGSKKARQPLRRRQSRPGQDNRSGREHQRLVIVNQGVNQVLIRRHRLTDRAPAMGDR
jgi:hypothetical protein